MKSGINILGAVGIIISIGFMTATALADMDGHSWFGKNHGAGWHGGGSWHGEGGGPGYRSTWFDPWGFSFGAYEGPGYYYYPPLLADYYPPRSSDYHADTGTSARPARQSIAASECDRHQAASQDWSQ